MSSFADLSTASSGRALKTQEVTSPDLSFTILFEEQLFVGPELPAAKDTRSRKRMRRGRPNMLSSSNTALRTQYSDVNVKTVDS